jgi:hypothetical protein
LNSNRPSTRARAYASIGHQQFGAGRLEESLVAFRQALLEDGSDENARHDYEVVLRLLHPGIETPGVTPTAEASSAPSSGSETPGTQPPDQAGPGTPGADGTPEGTPTPAPSATASASAGAGGTPDPTSAEEIDRELGDIDQQVNRLLEAAGETPSPGQALEILKLLAERTRIASLRDALNGGSGPKDY